jgi:hypothetical protein
LFSNYCRKYVYLFSESNYMKIKVKGFVVNLAYEPLF